jgi:hypothetical protein
MILRSVVVIKIRNKLAIAITSMSLVFLTACVSDVANRYYLDEVYPAKNVDEVAILQAKPDRPFVVIADFQSRGESAGDLRRKAAEIGADAVIVVEVGGSYSRGEEWAHTDKYKDRDHSHILGTAIRFIKE